MYNFYERYNDEGVLRQSGEQTAENEFTIYLHEGDSKRAIEAYICHEDGYDLVYYSDDGSISSQKTYGYDEIHYR